MQDAASDVINSLVTAMKQAFKPDSSNPPLGGGTDIVRVFTGDSIPIDAFDAHQNDVGCDIPFLWVRLVRRYRTSQFPTPFVGPAPCNLPVALAVEVGVGRCSFSGAEPDWEYFENLAEIGLDDSWRIELALCRASALIQEADVSTNTAVDAVVPFGPDGGVVAWLGTMYVQI